MFVILTNTHISKVEILIILEGLEYPVLSVKGCVNITQKGGRVLSTFLFPLDASTGWGGGTSDCSLLSQLKMNYVVLLLATSWLYMGWGVGGGWVCLTVHCIFNYIPQHVKMTLCNTTLGHQMTLGGRVCLTVHFILNYIAQHLNITLHSTTIWAADASTGGYIWPGYICIPTCQTDLV